MFLIIKGYKFFDFLSQEKKREWQREQASAAAAWKTTLLKPRKLRKYLVSVVRYPNDDPSKIRRSRLAQTFFEQ